MAGQRDREAVEARPGHPGPSLKAKGPEQSGPFLWCAEHVRQLGGGSPLSNLVEVKD